MCHRFIDESHFMDVFSRSSLAHNTAHMNGFLEDVYHTFTKSYYHSQMLMSKPTNSVFRSEGFTQARNRALLKGVGSTYMPASIRTKIDDESTAILTARFMIGQRRYEIVFVLPRSTAKEERATRKQCAQWLSWIQTWFLFLASYAFSKCTERLQVIIYLTDAKKVLPKSQGVPLGPKHVNSALSDVCRPSGKIVIFRQEEWLKSLIHESLHNFGLDFVLIPPKMDKEFANRIAALFNIPGIKPSALVLTESYTEFWAEVLCCAFKATNIVCDEEELYSLNSFGQFKDDFGLYMNLEICFGLLQVNKICEHYGLTYQQLVSASTPPREAAKFTQKTHVFEYYILKAILLYNYKDFIHWCGEPDHNGENILNFNKHPEKIGKTLGDLYSFIKKRYRAPGFMDDLKNEKTIFAELLASTADPEKYTTLKNTLRMTVNG